MEKLWITILMNGVTVSMTYSRRNPAIYYFTDKKAEINRPNKKILKESRGTPCPHRKIFDRVGSLSNSCIRQICKIQLYCRKK